MPEYSAERNLSSLALSSCPRVSRLTILYLPYTEAKVVQTSTDNRQHEIKLLPVCSFSAGLMHNQLLHTVDIYITELPYTEAVK